MTITKPCEGGKTEAEMERAHPEHQRGLDQFIPCIGCFGKPCSRFPLDVFSQLNITRLTLRHRVIVGSFTSVSTTSGGKMMQASSLVWPCKAFLFVKGRFFPPSEQSTYAKDVVRWGGSLRFTQTAVNMLHCWSAADRRE